jgi:serine/threonine protein kinase
MGCGTSNNPSPLPLPLSHNVAVVEDAAINNKNSYDSNVSTLGHLINVKDKNMSMFNHNIKKNSRTIIKELDSGSTSIIHLVSTSKQNIDIEVDIEVDSDTLTNPIFADSDKSYFVEKVIDISLHTTLTNDAVCREIEIMELLKNIDNENLIMIRRSFVSDISIYTIQMEYADGGNLQQYIDNMNEYRKSNISESIIMDIIYQIANGLLGLHNYKIIHRDMKPTNIFITKSGIVKIGDFGISIIETSITDTDADKFAGTYLFTSPEGFCGKIRFEGDMWALGVILYYMTHLKLPFTGTSVFQLMTSIINQPPKWTSRRLESAYPICQLIDGLLEKDIVCRLTISQVRSIIKPHIDNIINSLRDDLKTHLAL